MANEIRWCGGCSGEAGAQRGEVYIHNRSGKHYVVVSVNPMWDDPAVLVVTYIGTRQGKRYGPPRWNPVDNFARAFTRNAAMRAVFTEEGCNAFHMTFPVEG